MKKIIIAIALMFTLPFAANVAAETDAPVKEHHMQNTHPVAVKAEESALAPVSSEHHMRNADPDAEAKAVARAEARVEAKEVEQSMSQGHHMKSTAVTAPASEGVQKAPEHTMKNN